MIAVVVATLGYCLNCRPGFIPKVFEIDRTKELCPLFDETEILISEHFPISGQNVKF